MTDPASEPALRPTGTRRVAILKVALALLAALLMLWPVAWMVSTSFKPPDAVFRIPPRWLPEEASLAGYEAAFSWTVLRYFLNGVIVASATAVLATGAGALCAYGLSRLRFRGTQAIMLFRLGSRGLPIPLYLTFFFNALLRDYEDAAHIDGAMLLQVVTLIILPLVRPGLAAAGSFVFVTSWNEFIFGMTFVSSDAYRPIPAAMGLLFLNEFQYRWGDTMAVAAVVTLPIMVLFVLFQKHFVHGITAGALTG